MGVGNTKILLAALIISWALLALNVYSTRYSQNSITIFNNSTETQAAADLTFIESLFGNVPEKPSPCDRVKESQILVFNDHILINVKNAEWATFTDTNSMDPVIDSGANALEYIPAAAEEICVGDIVSYRSRYADGIIIHRVVEISTDSQGWYAVMKGDNNPYSDPGRVRFDQIERVVIGIIY
ncbi:MAG: hypothetical protein ABIG95_00400 [Candidatus Woesearchaeota archaeon]